MKYVSYRCVMAKLTKYASWIDANNIHHTFFNAEDKNICGCHLNQTCFSNNPKETYTCHCDYKDHELHRDEITITSKVVQSQEKDL